MANFRFFTPIWICGPIFALCLGVLHSPLANAGGGMDGGGGGNAMKAQFISVARGLVDNPKFSVEDRESLAKGLHAIASVSSVAVLKYADGIPVADQKLLLAWTNVIKTPSGEFKAQIQLKQMSHHGTDEDSWQAHYSRGENLDDQVFHEVMRASARVNPDTQLSVDENYELSRVKYQLDVVRLQQMRGQALTSVIILNDYGHMFCAKLGDESQTMECEQMVLAGSQMFNDLILQHNLQYLDAASEWSSYRDGLEGLLLRSDRNFGEEWHDVSYFQTQELLNLTNDKGNGLDIIRAALAGVIVAHHEPAKNAREEAFRAYLQKYDDAVMHLAWCLRSVN